MRIHFIFCAGSFLLAVNAASFAQQSGSTPIVGGPNGTSFSDPEPRQGARILEVYIRVGEHVDSLQFVYGLPDGSSFEGPRHGGGGGATNVFRLDNDEYIVGITGRSGDYIDSIRFITNKRSSPIFGGRGGSHDYNVQVPAGNRPIGLTGRTGNYLDAVGLTYTSRYTGMLPIPGASARPGRTTTAGGSGGSAFADEEIPADARIAEVRVSAGQWIDSIQAIYVLSDGARHGGGGGTVRSFRLDSDEYITGLSGRYGQYLDSQQIHTNKRSSQILGGGGGGKDYRIDVPAGN
jgi:jacalin-like lectin domain-containing protein